MLMMGKEKTRSLRVLMKLHVQLRKAGRLFKVLSAKDDREMVLQESPQHMLLSWKNLCGQDVAISLWKCDSITPENLLLL